MLTTETRIVEARAEPGPVWTFAFSPFDGDVLVRDVTYADPGNREYRVRVPGGVPTARNALRATLSGPYQRRGWTRRPILNAAAEMGAVADGGPRFDAERRGG